MGWQRSNPVIDKILLREVVTDNAELLYQRDYKGLYQAYAQAAFKLGKKAPTWEGLTMAVKRNLLPWEKQLREEGKVS